MEDRVGAHGRCPGIRSVRCEPAGSCQGELNGDGIEYQLLVIDQPTPEGLVPGQHGPNRVLLLLRGDGRGRWQLAARNDKLVPCSTRGIRPATLCVCNGRGRHLQRDHQRR